MTEIFIPELMDPDEELPIRTNASFYRRTPLLKGKKTRRKARRKPVVFTEEPIHGDEPVQPAQVIDDLVEDKPTNASQEEISKRLKEVNDSIHSLMEMYKPYVQIKSGNPGEGFYKVQSFMEKWAPNLAVSNEDLGFLPESPHKELDKKFNEHYDCLISSVLKYTELFDKEHAKSVAEKFKQAYKAGNELSDGKCSLSNMIEFYKGMLNFQSYLKSN